MNNRAEGEYKLYDLDALVRADCHDCKGCSTCCRGMGDTIRLDPYDAYQLQQIGQEIGKLMEQGRVALTVWEGMILPHLQMQSQTDACTFLDSDGRCGIHAHRPGICRLFPLGRNYTEEQLQYFLLEDVCENRARSKIRISKWLGIEPAKAYHAFVQEWHRFRREMVEILKEAEEEQAKQLNLYLLQTFFLAPYDIEQDFYEQFAARAARIRNAFAS